MTSPIRTQLQAELRRAIQARHMATVATLRTLLGTIDNAEAVPIPEGFQPQPGVNNDVPRKVLSEAEIQAILDTEREQRVKHAATYAALGKSEEAARLQAEAALIARYLADSSRAPDC